MYKVDIKSQDKGYDLSKDSIYMSPQMLSYFTDKLKNLQHHILQREHDISFSMINNPTHEPDSVDQGIMEEYNFNQFSFQEQQDHLLKEIQDALRRIENGTYGYCQETQETIGIERLEAVPYARYCAEAQSRREQRQK